MSVRKVVITWSGVPILVKLQLLDRREMLDGARLVFATFLAMLSAEWVSVQSFAHLYLHNLFKLYERKTNMTPNDTSPSGLTGRLRPMQLVKRIPSSDLQMQVAAKLAHCMLSGQFQP